MLDSIINSDRVDKNNKTSRKSKSNGSKRDSKKNGIISAKQESMEVLDIDPRLFRDAQNKKDAADGVGAEKRSMSSNSTRSSHSSSDSDSDESSDDIHIDPYAIELTYSQFNIVLNNHNIEVSPDMSGALIWLLLDTNNLITKEQLNLGLESDNLHNNPMKERAFHAKQFKVIFKCRITYSMIETLMTRIASDSSLSQNKSLHPKHLSYHARNFVIWDKILEHLVSDTTFNVEEEYLYGALSEEELRDGEVMVNMLSSLDSHWQHRVQLMSHIDDKLNAGSPMERDIFFAAHLLTDNRFTELLRGWAIQLSDDRSGVAKTGVVLLPALLSSILLCCQFPGVLFDASLLNAIYDGIFALVKNRRLKDMADDAYETLIQVTDVLAEVADQLDDYALMHLIVDILSTHGDPKIERHEKAREACVGGIGFLLYGIAPEEPEMMPVNKGLGIPGIPEITTLKPGQSHHQVISTPMGSLHDDEEDEGGIGVKSALQAMKEMKDGSEEKGESGRSEISVIMQRVHLLENEQFVTALGGILKHGVTDKAESGRRKSFKLLQRLEGEKEGALLEPLLAKWDFTVQKKYKNWKKLNARKAESKKKKKGKGKGKGKNKRKKSAMKAQLKNKQKNGKGKGKSKKKAKNIKFAQDAIVEETVEEVDVAAESVEQTQSSNVDTNEDATAE